MTFPRWIKWLISKGRQEGRSFFFSLLQLLKSKAQTVPFSPTRLHNSTVWPNVVFDSWIFGQSHLWMPSLVPCSQVKYAESVFIMRDSWRANHYLCLLQTETRHWHPLFWLGASKLFTLPVLPLMAGWKKWRRASMTALHVILYILCMALMMSMANWEMKEAAVISAVSVSGPLRSSNMSNPGVRVAKLGSSTDWEWAKLTHDTLPVSHN